MARTSRDKTRNGNPYRDARRAKHSLRHIADTIGTSAM